MKNIYFCEKRIKKDAYFTIEKYTLKRFFLQHFKVLYAFTWFLYQTISTLEQRRSIGVWFLAPSLFIVPEWSSVYNGYSICICCLIIILSSLWYSVSTFGGICEHFKSSYKMPHILHLVAMKSGWIDLMVHL